MFTRHLFNHSTIAVSQALCTFWSHDLILKVFLFQSFLVMTVHLYLRCSLEQSIHQNIFIFCGIFKMFFLSISDYGKNFLIMLSAWKINKRSSTPSTAFLLIRRHKIYIFPTLQIIKFYCNFCKGTFSNHVNNYCKH